jgi:hypothetical protein
MQGLVKHRSGAAQRGEGGLALVGKRMGINGKRKVLR